MDNKYTIDYCLRFFQYDDFKNVSFGADLTIEQIESLSFLFSVYYDQKDCVKVKGLTFFTEFFKIVQNVKKNFESRDDNSDIKRIFSIFLKDEFMNQVTNFQQIIQYLRPYYKPIMKPNIDEIASLCVECPARQIACLMCKSRYVSVSISVFDVSVQEGWDIFLRPMFGLPIFLNILLHTRLERSDDIFKIDDIITNSFTQFFYNLLCDKAFMLYSNKQACAPFVKECRKVLVGVEDKDLELLLTGLNSYTFSSKLYSPFKLFMQNLSKGIKVKKVNKIASVLFTGFFLRHYLEAAPNKTKFASELEIRNVCRLIMKQYNDEQFECFINKLKDIKTELSIALMKSYIVPENFIRHLCIKHNLDKDISLLIDQAS
jgi:hypothetical protein